MAEPRATINQIDLNQAMSMNKMQYDIAPQGIFEKNTTVRDNTLQCYFRKEIDYEQYETPTNVVYTKDGTKVVCIARTKLKKIKKLKCDYMESTESLIFAYREKDFWLEDRDTGERKYFASSNINATNIKAGAMFSYNNYEGAILYGWDATDLYIVMRDKTTKEWFRVIWGGSFFERIEWQIPNYNDMYFIAVYPQLVSGVLIFSLVNKLANEDYKAGKVIALTMALKIENLLYDDIVKGRLYEVTLWDETMYFYNGVDFVQRYNIVGEGHTNKFLHMPPTSATTDDNTKQCTLIGGRYITYPGFQKKYGDTITCCYGYHEKVTLDMQDRAIRFCSVPKVRPEYEENEWRNYVIENAPYTRTGNTVTVPYGVKQDFNLSLVGGDIAVLYNNGFISGLSCKDVLLEGMFQITDFRKGKDNWSVTYAIGDYWFLVEKVDEPCNATLFGDYILTDCIDAIFLSNGAGGRGNALKISERITFNAFNDYNNRLIPILDGVGELKTFSLVSAYRNGYRENDYGQSWCPPVVMVNAVSSDDIRPIGYIGYGASDVNIYQGKNTMPEYLYSYPPKIEKEKLADTFYYGENTAGLFYFSHVIDGEGVYFIGNDNQDNNFELLQKEGVPTLTYNPLLSLGVVENFFVIQKQAFIIRNNCIYAANYTNGALTNLEFVVKLGANKYIGNTLQFAFFYNDNLKQVYLFSGDSNMQLLFYAYKLGRIVEVYRNLTEMGLILATESRIFYVQGEDIFARDIASCKKVYFTDNGIYYLCNNKTIFESLNETAESVIEPLHIQTAYIGTGRNELAENNCWYITLFNRHKKENGSVKVIGRCINTSSLIQKEKELHLTMQDFTEEGLCFIRFQPQVQNTVGTSIEIISDYDIQYLALGYMPQGIQQITKINI